MSGHGTKDDAPDSGGATKRPPDPRRALGQAGEARAARFLEARGYRIVARNVRADRVEIDLIARRGTLLVFVEVKTRRWRAHAEAAEGVDARKQHRLRRGAAAWLACNPPEARGTRRRRFDVVTCVLGDREGDPGRIRGADGNFMLPNETTAPRVGMRWSIEHWEAAF